MFINLLETCLKAMIEENCFIVYKNSFKWEVYSVEMMK